MEESRVCTCCGKEKHIDAFRFLNVLGRYQSRCLECEREYQREYNAKVRDHKKKANGDYRRRYAVRSIRYYIHTYGKEILDEALEEKKKA